MIFLGSQISRALIAILSTAASISQAQTKLQNYGEGTDHFVSIAPSGWMREFNDAGMEPNRAQCEQRIAAAACSTNAATSQIADNWSSIRCLPDSQTFAPALLALYDEMPERLRPSFCSLSRIFISDNIASVAFASPIVRALDRPPIGGFIGIRKPTLLRAPAIDALVTWKEQLIFGGSEDFLVADPALVQIRYGLKTSFPGADGLFYVLMHELGHLIDFNNGINASTCGRYGPVTPSCGVLPGSWAAKSWQNAAEPLAEASFTEQTNLCYYGCTGPQIDPLRAFELYSSLAMSAFLTAYSGMTPMEDFAEFWTWNLLRSYKQIDYVIQVPGQGEIRMNDAMAANPRIAEKLDAVNALWNSPGLKIVNGP